MPKRNNKAEVQKEQKKMLRAIAKEAQLCYKDPKFQRYRNLALAYKESLIKDLIEHYEPDPLVYAFTVKEMLVELRLLMSMLDKVEGPAKSNKEVKDVQ